MMQKEGSLGSVDSFSYVFVPKKAPSQEIVLIPALGYVFLTLPQIFSQGSNSYENYFWESRHMGSCQLNLLTGTLVCSQRPSIAG